MNAIAAHMLRLLVLIPLVLSSSHADQNDEALPELFTKLQAASNAQQALAIEREIWQKWYERDDKDGGNSMTAAVEAMTAGRYTIALNLLNNLVDEEPDFAEAWNRRQTTLTLEPRHFGAISGIGLIMLQLGEHERAMHAFEKVLTLSPHNSGAAKSIKELEQKMGTSI